MSSDPEVATVDTEGLVTAQKPGTTTITALASNGQALRCAVTVTSDVGKVTLNKHDLLLRTVGAKEALTASVAVEGGVSVPITWVSSNPGVATVDASGVVTAVADGEAKITALSPDGRFDSCSIFVGLAAGPGPLQAARQKLKALELLLYLSEMTPASQVPLTQYRAEQIAVIRQIHAQMIENMAQRFTIEALARQYLMNPTTLKEVFKSVYGTSIAAHIKEHRMQRAAELLQMTSLSLAEIAQAVGYSSQGKFTAAFKAYYQVPPKAFKKRPPDQSALPDCPCCK